MYDAGFWFCDNMTVKDVLQLIKNYPDYRIHVFDKAGIIIHCNSDLIAIEGYIFNSNMFSYSCVEEYCDFLSESQIYYSLTVKDFIEIIEPYLNADIEIAGTSKCVMFIGDNRINFSIQGEKTSDTLIKMLHIEGKPVYCKYVWEEN